MILRTGEQIKCAHIDDIRIVETRTEVLYKNSTITFLDLSFSKFNFEDIRTLSDALCINDCITSLKLYSCGLDSKDAELLADALCKNTILCSLDVSSNYLYDEGEKATKLYKQT
ncbi:20024_t:CDS:2 [Cetraspora pellucida]|uniref:20024_t:CDS:1 n=1 Tax=Cetraspora pellucida TaxID=1433469 RepID=A0A9N9EDL5_9GLOM|nr:20024_t:CDS:2 [Cetraspora pellucida]